MGMSFPNFAAMRSLKLISSIGFSLTTFGLAYFFDGFLIIGSFSGSALVYGLPFLTGAAAFFLPSSCHRS